MRFALACLILPGLVVHWLASPAAGWSHKEHVMLTRLAAWRLMQDPDVPADFRALLAKHAPPDESLEAIRQFWLEATLGETPDRQQVPGELAWWAIRPDLARAEPGGRQTLPSFGLPEGKLHYIDLELFGPADAPKRYRHDLSGLPPVHAVPDDLADERYLQAGALPLAVAHYTRQLAALLPADHAVPAAGYLAHYVQDNTQPHHATLDFRSHSYFAHPRQAPNIHGQMEWVHAESPEMLQSRRRTWDAMLAALDEPPPEVDADPFVATVQVAVESYRHLPLIGLAAMHAGGQAGTPDTPKGPARPAETFDTAAFYAFEHDGLSVEQMKARQLARAVHRTQQAWRAAAEDARR